MSLQALSTELDLKIFGYLDRGDMDCVTRISKKYYRRVGEPSLYHRIELDNGEDDRIKRLLITLLRREDLRRLIHHFELNHYVDFYAEPIPFTKLDPVVELVLDSDGDGLYSDLMARIPEITGVLDAICTHYNNIMRSQFKMMWLTKVLEPYPLFDGALSLILSMARRIKTIHLETTMDHALPMTRHIIDKVATLCGQGSGQPLHELEKLCIRSADLSNHITTIPITQNLATLRIEGSQNLQQILYPNVALVSPGALSSLKLKNLDMDPLILQKALASPFFRSLKCLVVEKMGHGDYSKTIDAEDPWKFFNYEALKQAMLQHTPNLEVFHWTEMHVQDYDFGDIIPPFGSFAGFTQMKELVLDCSLVLGDPFRERILDYFPTYTTVLDYLPPDMELFEVRDVDWIALQPICEMRPHGLTGKLSDFEALLISRLPKQMNLVIDKGKLVGYYFDTDQWHPLHHLTVSVFRMIADTMHSSGKQLKVVYAPDTDDDEPELLVGSGFTAERTTWFGDD